MDTASIFQTGDGGESQLWKLTWDRIDAFLPRLKGETFKPRAQGMWGSNLAPCRVSILQARDDGESQLWKLTWDRKGSYLFLIPRNFFLFHRNKFLSFMPMKFKYVFINSFKEIIIICFNTLKTIMGKYGSTGELWFFALYACDFIRSFTLYIVRLWMICDILFSLEPSAAVTEQPPVESVPPQVVPPDAGVMPPRVEDVPLEGITVISDHNGIYITHAN